MAYTAKNVQHNFYTNKYVQGRVQLFFPLYEGLGTWKFLLHTTNTQWAGWRTRARCAWTEHAQCTDVKFKQPLIMRECLPGQVCRAGNASHTAWTAGGVRAVHWLMFRFISPSSSYLFFFIDAQISCLFLTRLWAKEYIALSVMFWQKYRPSDLRWGQLFANAITLSSAARKIDMLNGWLNQEKWLQVEASATTS